MRPSRRRRARWLAIVTALAGAIQLPALWAIGRLGGHVAIAVAVAAALNIPFVLAMRNPWREWATSRLWLYLGLWPFFAWGAVCLVFLLLLPPALLAVWLTPLTLDQALLACGAAALVFGTRSLTRRPRVVRRDVRVGGLPAALDGYRIAHISDLHCGAMAPPAQVRRWVERVNRLQPDLVAVTGDLITSGDAYVAAVAATLGELRGRDGVYACMGNHDYFTQAASVAHALERSGLPVLDNRGVVIARKDAALYVAGVDDTWTGRADVTRAMAGCPDSAPAVLLAHDPNLFPAAADAGADLVLSGHTHGGQFAVPGLARRLNLARVITRFTAGLYRQGDATLYVNRGLGFTGPPIRLGAPAEIAVLTLRPAEGAAARRADAAAAG